MSADGSIDELQFSLGNVTDRAARARVHVELARHTLIDGRIERAVRHLKEALLLDGRMDSARELMDEIKRTSKDQLSEHLGRRDALRALAGRVRGRG